MDLQQYLNKASASGNAPRGAKYQRLTTTAATESPSSSRNNTSLDGSLRKRNVASFSLLQPTSSAAIRRPARRNQEINPGVPKPKRLSDTRLFVGNLPSQTSIQDIQAYFLGHGSARGMNEIKLKGSIAFIKYDHHNDALDAVRACHGSILGNNRLTVTFSHKPRRTRHRFYIAGLRSDSTEEDFRELLSNSAKVHVVYCEITDTKAHRKSTGFIELESQADPETAACSLHGVYFQQNKISVAKHPYERPEFDSEKSYTKSLTTANMNGIGDNPLAILAGRSTRLSTFIDVSRSEGHQDAIYITRTISEDLSGTTEEIIGQRLAVLGARERC